jgi:hypothetical protein
VLHMGGQLRKRGKHRWSCIHGHSRWPIDIPRLESSRECRATSIVRILARLGARGVDVDRGNVVGPHIRRSSVIVRNRLAVYA